MPEGLEGQDLPMQDGDQGNESSTVNINPAWNDALSVIPEDVHSQVTPLFKKWDDNFQSKIQEVHSQYEPWKQFIENEISPGDVEYSLGLLQAIQDDPKAVMDALRELVDDGTEQQGQNGSAPNDLNTDQFDLGSNPKIQEMEQALQAVAQIMINQREEEQLAEAEKALDDDLGKLKEQYGDFDENYVIALASQGEKFDFEELEAAVKQFHELEQNLIKKQRQPGPPILGSGGSVPNQQFDPTKAKPSETKAMIAAMLEQAERQT